jgi:hypothetical protein
MPLSDAGRTDWAIDFDAWAVPNGPAKWHGAPPAKFANFGRSAAAEPDYRPGPSRWNDFERGGTHRLRPLRVTLHSQLDGV